MKKISIIRFASIVGVWAIALPLLAATTASLSPSQTAPTVGKTFTVSVSIDPQGAYNFAEKLEIDYPSDILEVRAFSFSNNWTPLSQPGYDVTDNTNGIMIKTAGYAGGVSQPTSFGTVTFYAKKSGNGTIRIGNGSLAFEAQKQSVITGNGANIAVFSVTVPAKTTTSVKPSVSPIIPDTTPGIVSPSQTPDVIPAQTVQTAAAADAANYSWLWIVGIIIVLVGLGLWIFRRRTA